jgi:uncharacterized membrane protein
MTDSPSTRAAADPSGKAPRQRGRLSIVAGRIGSKLRNWFLTGVIVTAPIGITLYIVWSFIEFTDNTVSGLIPEAYLPNWISPLGIPGSGLVLALILLTLVGFLTANIIGRRLVRLGERIVVHMPIIRSIYSALKQLFETMLTRSSNAFRKVVLVEFPRDGAWSIAFLTNESPGEITHRLGEDIVAVYLPTAVNPTSGYLLFVPRASIVPLNMTVEDAMKMVLSGGLVTTPERLLPVVTDPAGAKIEDVFGPQPERR